MKKSDAVKIFGNQSDLAKAIGLSKSAVSQWPDPLRQAHIDRVIGAAVRLGKDLGKIGIQSSSPKKRPIKRRVQKERRVKQKETNL